MPPGGLAETDLVLGFERMHVIIAVVDGRAVRDRSFTLPEFVGLVERLRPQPSNAPGAHARSLVRTAAALRPPDPQLLSVPELGDPFRRTAVEQDQIAEQIRSLVERLAVLLFGSGG
jgi:hypothetical protein